MKILTVDAIPLDARLARPFKFGHVERTHSSNVIIRITSDSGHVGWGEACPVPQLTGETQLSVVAVVQDRLARLLVGTDPFSWRATLAAMEPHLVGYTFTRAAIETSLLDLIGKVAGMPLWQVLGGRYREEIELHGSIGWDARPEVVADEALRQSTEFRTLKLYVGRGAVDADLATVERARVAVGDHVEFIVDVNGLWSRSDAVRAGQRLADAGVRIVEQPLPPSDLEGAVDLTRLYQEKYGIEVAVDEGLRSIHDAVDIGVRRAASVATVAVCKLGGPARALEMASISREFGLTLMVGSVVELGIAAAAGAHLAACLEGLERPAYLMGPYKYDRQITGAGMSLRAGMLSVPDGAGLGVEIDEDAIRDMDLRGR